MYKISAQLIKIAKLLLADIGYFQLPKDLLNEVYQQYQSYINKYQNRIIKPHIMIVVDLSQYLQSEYKYIDYFDQDINYLVQILFFDLYNREQQVIGDKYFDFNQMMNCINKINSNTQIKGVTDKTGDTIVIQQRQENIKHCLQHELIHSIRYKLKMKSVKLVQQKTYNKFLKRYLLSNNQLASMVTDCCNYYQNNYNQFIKDLKMIDEIYKNSFQFIFEYLQKNFKQQFVLFLTVLKKYKPKKFNKVVSFIRKKLKQ